MVHALKQIHRLLQPDGVLIDIRPHPEGAFITLYQEDRVLFSERKRDYDSEDQLAADRAIAEVLQQGLFDRDRSIEFVFNTHASSVPELRQYWEEIVVAFDDEEQEPAQLAREDRIFNQVEQLMSASSDWTTVAMRERCRMARLRRLS